MLQKIGVSTSAVLIESTVQVCIAGILQNFWIYSNNDAEYASTLSIIPFALSSSQLYMRSLRDTEGGGGMP